MVRFSNLYHVIGERIWNQLKTNSLFSHLLLTNSNPSWQAHSASLPFFLHICSHPPFASWSHGWTKIKQYINHGLFSIKDLKMIIASLFWSKWYWKIMVHLIIYHSTIRKGKQLGSQYFMKSLHVFHTFFTRFSILGQFELRSFTDTNSFVSFLCTCLFTSSFCWFVAWMNWNKYSDLSLMMLSDQ